MSLEAKAETVRSVAEALYRIAIKPIGEEVSMLEIGEMAAVLACVAGGPEVGGRPYVARFNILVRELKTRKERIALEPKP